MSVCSKNVIRTYLPCCLYHVTYSISYVTFTFTAIHKSSPVASWDSKVPMECMVIGMLNEFCPLLFFTFDIVGKYAISDPA